MPAIPTATDPAAAALGERLTREDGVETGPFALLCVCSDPGHGCHDPGHRQAVRDNLAALQTAGDEWAYAGRPLPEAVAAMRDEIARLRAECCDHEERFAELAAAVRVAEERGRQLVPFTPEG